MSQADHFKQLSDFGSFETVIFISFVPVHC